MTQAGKSPKISDIQWGKIQTEDGSTYKDAKLYPDGARAWDWNETGTHHKPGILPADVEELLEHDAEVIVLSKGFHERLQVSDETLSLLKEKGIPYHILQTQQAVDKYNELTQKHRVGALIHSTC